MFIGRQQLLQRSLNLKTIRVSQRGSEARIVLSRPRAGNRVNRAMVEDLAQAVDTIDQDDSVRVVVIIGRGSVFSSGWERLRIDSPEELARYQAARVVGRIRKPVVAAINGDAIGQGLELALAADIRIVTNTARLGLPQVKSGVMPWDGGTQRLPRIAGRAHAIQLLLTGAIVDAVEAQRMGIVNLVSPPERFAEMVDAVASQIASAGPLATRYAKETVAKGMDVSLDQGLRMEADLNILLHSSSDRAEGIRSFLERRLPRFRGE